MARLSTYTVEWLRAKAQEARVFAQRCEDEADPYDGALIAKDSKGVSY